MLDRRDLLLDKLSTLAQVTVTKQADGTDTVSFGDAAEPLVEGSTVNWPQTLTSARGGQARGAAGPERSQGGTLAGYQTSLDEVADALASSRQRAAHRHAVLHGDDRRHARGRGGPGAVQTSSTGAAGGNDVALAIAALRGGAADQRYSALVEQVGSDVMTREGRARPTSRRWSRPSATSARASRACRSMKK